MAVISVQVTDKPVLDALQELSRRVSDISEPLNEIGIEFAERIRGQFGSGQSPYGDKWAKLSEVTQAKNKGRRRGGQPLLDTGRLRASITSRMIDGGNAVSIGATNVQYANTQQFGARQGQYGRTRRNGPIPWGNVPARPYMPIVGNAVVLPNDWSQTAVDIIADYLTEVGK